MHGKIKPILRLPVGCDEFGKLLDNKLIFIDKSLFIREIIEDTTEVILITRPRRFGKTLNMSLLHYFFAEQVLEHKTAGMFDHLQIAQYPECMAHQGKYPVVSITFKDMKNTTYQHCYDGLCQALQEAYRLHENLISHEKLPEPYQQEFAAVLYSRATEKEIRFALLNLTRYLYQCYGVRPIILIDEYDTPIQSGYQYQYYEEAVQLIREILSPALKNNRYLHKAVLTGVTRVAKEGIFSGLNNVEVYSLLHQRYSEYFGFTEKEVQELLLQAGLENKAAEVRHWYNGYQIGPQQIYNPWSIVHYLKNQGKPNYYWVNTSDNFLLKELIVDANTDVKAQFQHLLQGASIQTTISDDFIFPEVKKMEETLWALLVMAGYLTPIAEVSDAVEETEYMLAIPNREVRSIYARFIRQWLTKGKNQLWYKNFIDQLLVGNIPVFETGIQHIILQIVSTYDVGYKPENFYHGLMLGLILYLEPPRYRVVSNRESGLGRYDIAIIPQNNQELAIILELKSVAPKKDNTEIEASLLMTAAKEAVTQINQRHYIADLAYLKFQRICKIGLAFCGKNLHIEYEIETLNLHETQKSE